LLIGLTLACITVLILAGRNPSEIEHVVGIILAGLGALAGGGAWLYAAAGSASSSTVEDHLNGDFDRRIKDILMAHDIEVHGAHPTVPPPVIATPPEGRLK
jgi:hypothetical protein